MSDSETPRRGPLLVIFLTVFIDLLGFGIVLPLLPIYGEHFAQEHQWSGTQVGWVVAILMSSFSAMQFLFLPVWGRVSDRYGRRPVLMIGLAASAGFYFLFGLATLWRSLTWMFVARIGAGIAGATISTAQAYIADVSPKHSRTKGMALIGAAFALGFTLGPLIGAGSVLVANSDEFSPWPGYVAAALSAVAFGLAIFKLPESLQPGKTREHKLFDLQGLKAALSVPSIGWLLLTSFILVFSFANFESTLSLQIKEIVEQQEGATDASPWLKSVISTARRWGYSTPAEIKQVVVLGTFTYLGLVLTFAQGFLVRRLAGRIPEAGLALSGAALSIAGFVCLALSVAGQRFGLLCASMAMEVVGFSLVSPSLQSLISRRSSPHRQGQILGISQSCSSLARILGPLFGIPLFSIGAKRFAAPELPYWAAAALMLLGLGMIAFAAPRGKDFDDGAAED